MKGQIYVMTMILIVIFLVMMKIETQVPSYESKAPIFQYYKNIESEAVRTVDLALLNDANVSSSLDDFVLLTSSTLDRHGVENDINYEIASVGNVTSVSFNIYLSFGQSFLSDSIEIERTVYR